MYKVTCWVSVGMARTKNTARRTPPPPPKPRGAVIGPNGVTRKLAPGAGGIRYRPGTIALRHIRTYQKADAPLLSKLPFKRLVQETAHDVGFDLLIRPTAVAVLQEAAEAYLVQLFEDSNLCAKHANRKTVTVRDMMLARRLRDGRV